jgi:hypothetical protein
LSFVIKKTRKTPDLNNPPIFPCSAGFRYFHDGDPYLNPYNMAVLTEGLGPPVLFQEEETAQSYYLL